MSKNLYPTDHRSEIMNTALLTRGAYAVYYLVDPRDGEIRYVGCTNNPARRMEQHVGRYLHRATHKKRWIKKLRESGLTPTMRLCCILEGQDEAWRVEREVIAILKSKGVRLTNTGEGGEGVTFTPEVRAKMSKSWKPRRMSRDLRDKLSAAAKTRWSKPGARDRAREAMKGRYFSFEHRAKISAAKKRQWADPEYRKKAVDGIRRARQKKGVVQS